uniref:DUF5824 domain-containing protein n=1 Tax=viral metagenome TaxID=1070528 RepID=A0A6C0I2F5_9ZZZZ
MKKEQKPTIPTNYLPKQLSKKDRATQKKGLLKTRKDYKKGKFYERKKVKTFKSKPSKHVAKAKEMYNVDKIGATAELAKATNCSIGALRKIIKKGKGAFYSSGSRPNQTASSWAIARLASAITGGKASKVDRAILEEGCSANSRALQLAQ